MKKLFLYIPAMLLIAVSCEKEAINSSDNGNEFAPSVKMITEIVSGSRGDATKATIGNTNPTFAWTVGDNAAVHVSKGDSHEYVTTSKGADAAASSAKFEVTYGEGYSRDAFAVYPSTIVSASAANFGQSGHTLDVTIPDSYTLAQVSGETSPCPMISANTAGDGWHFYQLCGLLRLTVNSIPATAKRLEIDFDGKQVWGDFSIASPVVASTAVITTAADGAHDIITITKDGTDVALGETSLTINIPLPTGDYSNITIIAYDEIAGGNALVMGTEPFAYSASKTKGVKRSTNLKSVFNFTFKYSGSELTNVRFARVFSIQNKLHNSSSYGPFTASSDADMPSPIRAGLLFDSNSGDQLAAQVITGDGKVYSGLVDVPSGGYVAGEPYDVMVDVNRYTFTISSGKKVFFSPGDLGIEDGVLSFVDPFTNWAQESTAKSEPAKRVWFDQSTFGLGDRSIYGVVWRIPGYVSGNYEWNNIVNRTMNTGVAPYYRVTIPGHQYCLLLPPDETLSSAIESDLTSGTVTDYVKYLGKGFVLLVNTNRGTYGNNKWSWGMNPGTYARQGFYWTVRDGSQRYYFYTKESDTPEVYWMANAMRNHIRYVKNVE